VYVCGCVCMWVLCCVYVVRCKCVGLYSRMEYVERFLKICGCVGVCVCLHKRVSRRSSAYTHASLSRSLSHIPTHAHTHINTHMHTVTGRKTKSACSSRLDGVREDNSLPSLHQPPPRPPPPLLPYPPLEPLLNPPCRLHSMLWGWGTGGGAVD